VTQNLLTASRFFVVFNTATAYECLMAWGLILFFKHFSVKAQTTLGEIILAMWGLDSRHVKTGSSVDTPARLGYVLSQSTFPVLINEPGFLQRNSGLVLFVIHGCIYIHVLHHYLTGGLYV